jgi:hypothetical protein
MISILIPARQEEYLNDTIEDVFAHAETEVEVLVGLDGWTTPLGFPDKNIRVSFSPKPIGQRAMQNTLARMARGNYVMKLDAHCSLQQGFDRILLEHMDENTVATGCLHRLHTFDWVDEKGRRTYQDQKSQIKREKVWKILPQPFETSFVFGTNCISVAGNTRNFPRETMSLQGSLFCVSRTKYWHWNLCDEDWGSWGAQGFEIAVKTWFAGGRVITAPFFYGHWFRTKKEDVPYEREEPSTAYEKARELAKHPKMQWLVKKFGYPLDWKSNENSKRTPA